MPLIESCVLPYFTCLFKLHHPLIFNRQKIEARFQQFVTPDIYAKPPTKLSDTTQILCVFLFNEPYFKFIL